MQWYAIAPACVCAVATVALAVLKACGVGSKKRGAVKMVASVSFLMLGICGSVSSGGISVLLACGLACASVGDAFLISRDDGERLLIALLCFAGASSLLFAFCAVNFAFLWQTAAWIVGLCAFLTLATLNVVVQRGKKFNFGKLTLPINAYSVCVCLCGSFGIATACFSSEAASLLFGLGCALYMVSDAFLAVSVYRSQKRIFDVLNTFTYFPGMLMIALSLFV